MRTFQFVEFLLAPCMGMCDCRNSVLMQGDDYYAIDKDLCYFFENGWEARMTKASAEPFSACFKRNSPKKKDAPTEWEDMGERNRTELISE